MPGSISGSESSTSRNLGSYFNGLWECSSDYLRERQLQQNLDGIDRLPCSISFTASRLLRHSQIREYGSPSRPRMQQNQLQTETNGSHHPSTTHASSGMSRLPSINAPSSIDNVSSAREAQSREYQQLHQAYTQRTRPPTSQASRPTSISAFRESGDQSDSLSFVCNTQAREYNRLQAHMQHCLRTGLGQTSSLSSISSQTQTDASLNNASDGMPCVSGNIAAGDSGLSIALNAQRSEYDRLNQAHIRQSAQESETYQHQAHMQHQHPPTRLDQTSSSSTTSPRTDSSLGNASGGVPCVSGNIAAGGPGRSIALNAQRSEYDRLNQAQVRQSASETETNVLDAQCSEYDRLYQAHNQRSAHGSEENIQRPPSTG